MTLIDLVMPGDKMDIQLMQQLELVESGEITEPAKTYKSRVFDFLSEKELEVAMPTESGRMVLFQVGLNCKLLFYSKRGLYTCQAVVKSRYKKDNFFMLSLLLQSEPVKFQRREFFRVECMVDFRYNHISEEVANLPSTESLFSEMQTQKYVDNIRFGNILDISGGGIRFSTQQKVENEECLFVIMHLLNNSVDQTFYLVVRVLHSERSVYRGEERYINRAKFLFKDLKDRETIVRYVFEEERRLRRKEIG